MDNTQYFLYLLLLAGSTYLIRAIPFALVKKKIDNRFVRSFLAYIPYSVLTAMTLPAALYATDYIWSAALGLAAALFFALRGKSLTTVAVAACLTVFASELIYGLFTGLPII